MAAQKKRPSREDSRLRLIQESARLMASEHLDDFHAAKRKAAQRLGVSGHQNLPSNQEIEQALREYLELFRTPEQRQRLREQRLAATRAMALFERFQPRLVGGVLSGIANPHSDIALHLFSDHPEEVAVFLLDQRIPYQLTEHTFQTTSKTYPVYRFVAGETFSVAAMVFSVADQRQAPPDPVTGKPTRRADLAAVRALLEAESPSAPV